MIALFDYSVHPTLETQRLILRELNQDDAQAVFRIRGDYEVTKYNGGAAYTTIDQAEQLIGSIASDFQLKESVRWGIVLKGTTEVIGLVGYNNWARQDHRASIGYDLARAYWGQGIMPEAIHAIIQFGFKAMGLNRVEADCSVLNAASARVLEKVGFQREGMQREQYFEEGQFHDLLLFGLLRREYKGNQSG